MKKRTFALLMAAIMVITLLAGCNNSAGTPQSAAPSAQQSTNAEQPTTPVVTDEEVTLTVWCWDPAYNINAMNVAERIYQQDHPNFHLEVVEMGQQDIGQKLATTTTAGTVDTLADIILFDDSSFQRAVAGFSDAFLDITDYGFDYSQFSANKVSQSVIDGRHYGIPFDSGTVIACYRTDILAEAGYTIDDFTDITWSEWIEKAKVVLEKTGHPLLNGQGSNNIIRIMFQSAGAGLFDAEGNITITNNDILKQSIETYMEMVNSGVYTEETAWDTYIGGLNTGRIGGVMNGCWIMASIESADDQSGLWAVTNLPSLDNVSSATHYAAQGGSSWALTKACKNPEAALAFMQATYGGSMEFYDEILPTGAVSTWLPAANSAKYEEPVEFFSNQPVFSMITSFSKDIPECIMGAYFSSAMNQVAIATSNALQNGTSIDAELKAAEETILFQMG